jgi:Family of unknown function (DUF5706)
VCALTIVEEEYMTDDKQRIDIAKWLFERTLGWIATSDVKVGVAMALDTAMLGGLAAAFSASEPHLRSAWCYLAVLTAAGLMVICAGMAAIPRMLGPVKSMIFFARVAEQQVADYVDQFAKMTEKDFLADLTTQIHRNSQIANEKHMWVRKALTWSFLAAIPWVVSICLLVKT